MIKLSAKTQKTIGIIWKVLSALVVALMAFWTISANVGASAATSEFETNLLKGQVASIVEQLKAQGTLLDDHDNIFVKRIDVVKFMEDNNKILGQLQTVVGLQTVTLGEIQKELDNARINREKFWTIDWTALQVRLNRMEDKIDEMR